MAVWVRVRSELRTRWRAALALAVLVGITGGVVMAASAGARRTHTAYTRFVTAQNAWDITIANDQSFGVDPAVLTAIERLPGVRQSARGILDYADLGVGVPFFAPADGRVGTSINRFKVLEGRRLDPARVDEAVISFVAADRYGVHVGDELRLGAIKARTARVVGIEAAPGEFPPQTVGLSPAIHLTPAAYRVMAAERDEDGSPPKQSLLLQLEPDTDVDAFRRKIEGLSPDAFGLVQRDLTSSTQRSFRLQSLALWILAGLTALVGLLVLSQVVARQVFIDARDDPTLGALGMTRGQRVTVGIVRAVFSGAIGAVVAIALAILLSPLTPVGLARTAEPAPGLRVDGLVIGLGLLATLFIVPVLALVPIWRVQRAAADVRRPSALASALSRTGFPVTTVTGARLALEPGRGRTAVPVKTTLATAVVGIASVAAAFTFGASLDHLITTPRLFGEAWDTSYTTFGEASLLPEGATVLEQDRAVAAYSIGTFGSVNIDDRSVGVIALDLPRGSVVPPILAGRAPNRAGEIALGTRTLEKLHKRIGDRVRVAIADRPGVSMRVVGRSVTPLFYGEARLGEGALSTLSSARLLDPTGEVAIPSEAVVRWAPGATAADKQRVFDLLSTVAGRSLIVLPRETPTDIVNFGRVQNLPFVLGAVLALLGAATLAHTLVTAIGRRRRDLAVLKTMGFVRRQVTSTVGWQATTMVAIALLVGIPFGVAAGRWAWVLLARQLGVVSEPVTPISPVLLIIPATLLLANLIALAPGSVAARIRPALALRAE
jgi:predicted lysophospholipase L1 biosynthesis ABC-type transport system permease subunit